ncbi:uncharacterized protein LOC125230889 isoform X2 [Leguminivora glycinivorella]|uniref:uncharacterized protein LOC125230889 isoform X2 n=1 Tax=Leguminivora glycinivorella TaxID=1035111 RepID=UPI00200CD693|nr:uncharacterized protein LOC125230889 isoform X2 [Leguminivora glycinivorella]
MSTEIRLFTLNFFVFLKAQDPPDCEGPFCPIKCPPGTYRYDTGCDYLQPEPTCKNPRPAKETEYQICDYQACYCSPPTVRNEETKQCVELCDCPRKHVTVTPRTPVTPVTKRTPVTPRTPVTRRTPVTSSC